MTDDRFARANPEDCDHLSHQRFTVVVGLTGDTMAEEYYRPFKEAVEAMPDDVVLAHAEDDNAGELINKVGGCYDD